jgi:protein-ribulosamine 3-kinase
LSLLADIAFSISRATHQSFNPADQHQTGGGCINQGLVLVGRDGRRFFVKLNDTRHGEMFAAEAEGLAELDATGAIRVPRPITHGVAGDQAFLVLEWLALDGRGSGADLGRRLATLHRTTRSHFGWHRDNTIGSTPQPNPAASDWLAFYGEQRLGHQLRLARRNGASARLISGCERLITGLDAFFPGYRPIPSLLHGDLWGGNYGFAEGGPVLFDPAVYFGDREADLAMTELFGGFPTNFHAAYREAWPLDPGYATRRILYNLYHVLNHFNLFGGGYASQAQNMIERLLAESH